MQIFPLFLNLRVCVSRLLFFFIIPVAIETLQHNKHHTAAVCRQQTIRLTAQNSRSLARRLLELSRNWVAVHKTHRKRTK